MTNLSFDEKIKEAQRLIAFAIEPRVDEVAFCCSGGKDSLAMLQLARDVFGGVPAPVYFGDTGVLLPGVYENMARLEEEWGLDIIRPELTATVDGLRRPDGSIDRMECCRVMKTEALVSTCERFGWDTVFIGVRRSECEARAETFPVSRSRGIWRIHPLWEWELEDVWEYLRRRAVPYPREYGMGYKSLGCAPCTSPTPLGAPERGGRDQDKEEHMRSLIFGEADDESSGGYFGA